MLCNENFLILEIATSTRVSVCVCVRLCVCACFSVFVCVTCVLTQNRCIIDTCMGHTASVLMDEVKQGQVKGPTVQNLEVGGLIIIIIIIHFGTLCFLTCFPRLAFPFSHLSDKRLRHRMEF